MATLYFAMATDEQPAPNVWDVKFKFTRNEDTMALDAVEYESEFASELAQEPDVLKDIEEHLMDYLENFPNMESISDYVSFSIVGKIDQDKEELEFNVTDENLNNPASSTKVLEQSHQTHDYDDDGEEDMEEDYDWEPDLTDEE